MARTVDFENLSADDLQYLSERTWLISEAVSLGHEDVPAQVKAHLAGAAEEDEEDEEVITYKQGKVEELRAELERRGLDTAGKKDELIARLEADDLAREDEED